MLPGASPRRSLAAIERLALDITDLRTLRSAVLEELRRTVGFDWYAWVLTDPATTVGTDPLAEVPDLVDLPRVIRLKYLTDTNRWSALESVALLGQRAADSLLWREAQRQYGVADVASMVLRDRHGTWAFLDLWSHVPYGGDDVAVLSDIAPTLTRAIRLGQAGTFRAVPTARQPTSGPVVLLLDENLMILGQTAGSADWLSVLLPRSEGAPIPACAYNVAAQLLASEADVDTNQAMGRVALSQGLWVTVRAARLAPDGVIAVTIEPMGPQDRLDVFSRASGLTGRERELLTALAHGADTREAAGLLCLSPHTVQDHLKAIFAKTGTSSRRSLMAVALGVQDGDQPQRS